MAYEAPSGHASFRNLRLLNAQILENLTGIGAPPWTWPHDEQVIDLLHIGIYGVVSDAVADRSKPGPSQTHLSRAGWTQADQQA